VNDTSRGTRQIQQPFIMSHPRHNGMFHEMTGTSTAPFQRLKRWVGQDPQAPGWFKDRGGHGETMANYLIKEGHDHVDHGQIIQAGKAEMAEVES
jgi:hypothetical protein